MRASDSQRERTVSKLAAGYANGLLGADTFAQRTELAYRADSPSDLRALTADLPRRVRDVLHDLRAAVSSALAPPARIEHPSIWLMPPDTGEGPWLIGRDESICDLLIDEETVSRRHAELRWAPEGYVVRDLRSKNGIRVNGVRVSSVLLRPGDELTLGRVRVRLSRRR